MSQFRKNIIVGVSMGAAAGSLTGIGAFLGLTELDLVGPTAIVCGLLSTLIHNVKSSITTMVDDRSRTLRTRLEGVRRDVGDIHGITRLAPYTQQFPLPFGGGWALTADAAAILAREVLLRNPSRVVELGSGVSTLILGQILKNRGSGKLLSIDHDMKWAQKTRANVAYLGLEDFVEVIDAPLVPREVDGLNCLWYDISDAALAKFGKVDFLFVDGPPQTQDSSAAARFPAFPMLREHLLGDAIIFVDDANRTTETDMVTAWMSADKTLSAERYDTVDGVCILRRSA